MFDMKEIEGYIQQYLQGRKKEEYQGRDVDFEREVFYFPLEPKKPISNFDKSSSFFLSKKIPLKIVA